MDKKQQFALIGPGVMAEAIIIGLVEKPAGRIVGGRVLLDGKDITDLPEPQMRAIRGRDISMIFQEPMTSLNPVFTCGNQIAEAITLLDACCALCHTTALAVDAGDDGAPCPAFILGRIVVEGEFGGGDPGRGAARRQQHRAARGRCDRARQPQALRPAFGPEMRRVVADLDPHEGDVFLDGTEQRDLPGPEWRRRVALLPAESGWWGESVGEHFAAPPNPDLLGALALDPGCMDWTVSRLSSGERQRLAPEFRRNGVRRVRPGRRQDPRRAPVRSGELTDRAERLVDLAGSRTP